MTTSKPPPVSVDQIIAGKYRVERVLGSGGMGVVVAAQHIPLGRRVALKFLAREAVSNKDALNRFLREGQALARITGPNVARVMDVGTLEHGEPYIVMEFLDGADLGAILKQREELPVEEAVGYVLQACEAVAEAHANGIVHRDLKPSNLFLTRAADGQALIKVLDFGISKSIPAEGADSTDVTTTGVLVGTPLYMSPEQIRDPRRVDARTDIWSLGVILYELLCGATPFDGETASGALAAIVADAHVPLRVLRKEVPNGLEDVVARCLKKDASGRFATIAELAQALGNFVPEESRRSVARISRMLGVPVSAPAQQLVISRHPSHDAHSTTVPSWEGLTTLTSSKTRRRALGLALVAAVVAAFLGLLSRGGVFSSAAGTSSSGPVDTTSMSVVAPPPPPVLPRPLPSPAPVPGAPASAELSDKEKPPKPAPSANKDTSRRRPRGEPRKPKSKQEPDDGTADRK